MRRLIYILALWAPIASAQCDVNISSWDATTGNIVIEALNSENCGCNEFTTEDNTCENSASPHVNNNTTVSHIVLGLHSPGLDYTWGCTTATNHPGWTFKVVTLTTDIGGWAVNPNLGNQTQNYPDVDLFNNSSITCALPFCDTVYVDVEVIEYLTDTLIEYVDVEWITTDTLYITDTIVEYVDLVTIDTVTLIETEYIEVVIENYIYETDTITEFVTSTIYIDCETGEECQILNSCDETSIYSPNVVTPNGDGWNDTWQIIADGACWNQWEVRVYNRWGGLVWISVSSIDEWEANVASGVYVYTITAHSSQNASVFEFNGTITVLY